MKKTIVMTIVGIMLIGAFLPIIDAGRNLDAVGFDKGPSYSRVVPMKKTTLIRLNPDELYDDYAYLAAIPTAVFNEDETLFSNPLLFYQDKMDLEDDEDLPSDAYTGIKYFMEDWMSISDKQLDKMTLIDLDKKDLDSDWDAKEHFTIDSQSPYEIAKMLALEDWSYSDEAVVAVIDEDFEGEKEKIKNTVEGTLPSMDVKKETLFTTKQTNSLNPVSEFFTVDENYKQVFVECWWDAIIIGGDSGTTIPTGDPDLQIAFKNGEQWMQAQISSDWNVNFPAGHEIKQSYVYKPGDWRVTLTDFPTESDTESPRKNVGPFTIQGSILGIFKKDVKYNIEVTQYPGIDIKIPDLPGFGVENAKFKLSWENPNADLGLTLLGPSGEAIYSEYNKSREDYQEFTIERLGECPEGEYYSISVHSINDISQPLNFEVEYSWENAVPKEKGDSLASATEGAILASSLNAPLLYVKPDGVPSFTKDVLYKLGVKHVCFVDIGGHASDEVEDEITKCVDSKTNYKELRKIYDKIREISGSNDIVFTTMDSWTSWKTLELVPDEETEESLYIGPAAYCAAHHGTPAIIIEMHPRLSAASTWHNEFWGRFSRDRGSKKPSVAEMVFTGLKIYDFLKDYDFDKEGLENIITVAGQYEIGIPWDRIFPGVANSGRICGTPVDASVWISRSMFYPILIYANPALQGEVTLETGSTSERNGLIGLLQKPLFSTLHITKDTHKEEFEYPTLCSFVTIKHRINERASKYYGSKYQCANGDIPGYTTTMEPIDQGVMEKYTGDAGMYFPDMTNSEVVPFYLERGNYDPVFSTRVEKVCENLNQGVIFWLHTSHGNQGKGGQTLFWDPQTGFTHTPLAKLFKKFTGAYKENNPWRGYDWLLGSTDEPDTMSMDVVGVIPFTNIKTRLMPATGVDWVLARKPIREKLVERPILGRFFDKIFTVDDLYDGITGSISYSKDHLDWKTYSEIEALLENLHSVGFVTSICQTSNTYFHLMMVRHGSVYQVQDPWPTSWYATVWQQSIPRDIILGYTVGEAYSRGISYVGVLYLGGGGPSGEEPQWWWDDAENVVYFGDPELRMFVPENEYSNMNNWDKPKKLTYEEELNLNGHMPFGATSYPHEKEPQDFSQYLIFIVIAVIVLLLIVAVVKGKKR